MEKFKIEINYNCQEFIISGVYFPAIEPTPKTNDCGGVAGERESVDIHEICWIRKDNLKDVTQLIESFDDVYLSIEEKTLEIFKK
jgi:hypothetical protein